MKTKILLLIFLIFQFSCEKKKTKIIDQQTSIVPIPKTINIDPDKRALNLSSSISFYSNNPEIDNLISVFEKEIESMSSIDIKLRNTSKIEADLIFEIDNNLEEEEYSIKISNNISINGGSYNALAMAKSTLNQLLKLKKINLFSLCLKLKINLIRNTEGFL